MQRIFNRPLSLLLLAVWLVFLLAWYGATFRAPTTVGWRDSGEFILTSFFLDIPHPAGFPVYSQLSNLFSLVIPGPIAWRVHIFSVAVIGILLYQLVELSREILALLKNQKKGSESTATFLSIIIVIASFPISSTFWRGLSTAEVYGLHALFLTGILRLITQYSYSRDVRFLYASSLLGGISLGNHVVGVLFGSWIALGLLLFRLVSIRVFVTCSLFGLAGLSTYAYLPARSLTSPPLNTGAPSTPSRFMLHVSDARDRDLRPESVQVSDSQAPLLVSKILDDLQRLASDISLPIAMISVLGALFILWSLPFVGFSLLGGIGTTLWFFMGWDLDPWIPATSFSLVFAAILTSFCITSIETQYSKSAAVLSLLILALVLGISTLPNIQHRLKEAPSESAIHFAEDTLRSVPPHGVLISDSSWFITRYAQTVEGVAPTVTSVYLPSLLFPKYFNPTQLTIGQERLFAQEGENPILPELTNLFQLISLASSVAPIQIDPNNIAITPLREIIQFEPNGTLQIRRGESSKFSPEFIKSFAHRLQGIASDLLGSSKEERSDGDEHIKIELLQLYSTLNQSASSSIRSQLCEAGSFDFITEASLPKSFRILNHICSSS